MKKDKSKTRLVKRKTSIRNINSLKTKPFKSKFPSYLTSHSKPQKLRKYIGSKKRLSKLDKVKVIPFLMVGKPKSIRKKDLTWPQAKRRFPRLKPMADTDRDGVKNMFDCRPFNKRKQGFEHDDGGRKACGFKGVTGDCFVRAYAITEGKNYQEAYDELATELKKVKPLKGKRVSGSGVSHPRTGIYKKHTDQFLEKKGYKWKATSGIGKGFQMHVKEGELPKGKNILRVSKHMIASEDQDWKDSNDASRGGTRGVYGYYHKPESKDEKLELKQNMQELIENDESNIEGSKHFDEEQEKSLYKKAEEGTLTPEDIEEHELENFRKDYDLKDEEDSTLDYGEEHEEEE